MSEARSLTPLSDTDYEAIEAAVMETSRGRWFMAEFARRNRHADTLQVLGAVSRLQSVIGLGLQDPPPEPGIGEAAALIADLRIDLERISGKAEERASGLAARIEAAAGTIVQATESIQEAAWSLREAGADEAVCNTLDQRAAEISAATATVEGTVLQIDKIADTVAMLDSNLRAVAGLTPGAAEAETFAAPAQPTSKRYAAPESDIDIVEIDDVASVEAASQLAALERARRETRLGSIQPLDDDIVFHEMLDETPAAPMEQHSPAVALQERLSESYPPAPPALPAAGSEAGLREIDALPVDRKLAYFA
ncbi:hypothetical protein ASE63_01190 [Bosea sp. Root381]|uniref:hypothetical protein n=1 Tax=Bosea sp. Root381 TaxID=1736524 RepID=UPI0006FD3A6C|nr:hypothetical protein [Bosea sp. Root381]KRE17842.1 hypothetical protein ASE63_01190 [Bosea sp. Root381]